MTVDLSQPKETGDVTEFPFAELVTVNPSCGPTQHDFTVDDASPYLDSKRPVLYCRQCGEVRRLEMPKP